MTDAPKRFKMVHSVFPATEKTFTEHDAPLWLTSENTTKGSTMDGRWVWDLVKALPIGGTFETDFQLITRIE